MGLDNVVINDKQKITTTINVVIPSGQTTSPEVDLFGYTLCGFFLPAALTGTSLKISAAPTKAGTSVIVQSAGIDYSLVAAPSKYVPVENVAITAAIRYIKLISGSAEAADRTIILAVRPV